MITKENIKDIYSLAPMQEAMLFHHLYDKSSTAYFEQLAIEVKGQVDKDCMQQAFNKLVEKYDIFRTVFSSGTGAKPRQVVLKSRNADIDYKDIQYLSSQDRQSYLKNFLEDDKRKGFNLAQDLLIRLTLIKQGESQFHLVLSFHHILVDGWCMKDVLTDLFSFYGYLLMGDHQAIQDNLKVSYPYSDFIKWLEKQANEKPLKYWTDTLEGYETQSGIDGIQPNPSNEYKQGSVEAYLDEKMTEGIESLSSRLGVTTNVVMQAAWGILLQKYTDMDDVVYGTVVSGRPSEVIGIDQIIGLFINTVPVRLKANNNTSYQQAISQVHQILSDIKEFEYFPLTEIQNLSSLKNNLVNHLFVYENFPVGDNLSQSQMLKSMGIEMGEVQVFEQTNYDLNVIVYPGSPYKLLINYNKNKYGAEEIRVLQQRYLTVLQDIQQNPSGYIKDLSLISQDEKQLILQTFNDTHVSYPRDLSIIDLFKEQVAARSSHLALTSDKQKFSYSELDRQSDNLAQALVEKGVHHGDFIGLYFNRSTEMIVSILAVLKAGATFVPLGTGYPKERLQYMESLCKLKLIIGNEQLRNQDHFLAPLIIYSDIKWHEGTFEAAKVEADDACYVMFTSGSTGEPKGVLVKHRNVVRLVKNNQFCRLNQDTKIALTGAPVFDATTFEIWGALLNGGTLHIIDQDTLLDVQKLGTALVQNDINTLWLTSPLFNQLTDQDTGIYKGLSQLVVGGDILSPEHIERVRLQYPNLDIINGYGPTENTTFSTTHLIKTPYHKIPIGKPISNSTAYVMDRHMQLQPVGLIGELYVGGDGVAQGYLNAPEQTQSKFIPNPFGEGMLYKTGDLAKWLPSGEIDFLGRRDFQVKIRGFRIELGEIEQALLQYSDIDKAIVIPKKMGGVTNLCAYYETQKEIKEEAIKSYLTDRLPEHMIPAYYVSLAQFPLNINGKIDRAALPEPTLKKVLYEAPNGTIETTIADVWKEVLGVETVGRNDNYFSIGGDSIKAIPIISRLKKLNIVLDVRDIFQYQTVAGLASHLLMMQDHTEGSEDEQQELVTLEEGAMKNTLYVMTKKTKQQFTTFEGQVLGTFKCDYGITGAQKGHLLSDYVTATIPMPFPKSMKQPILADAIKNLIQAQGLLRSVVIDKQGALFWSEHEASADINIPYVDLSTYSEDTSNTLIAHLQEQCLSTQHSARGKLMYSVLLVKKATGYLLFWRMNHALYDIMSLKIIPNTILSYYSALQNGQELDKTVIPYSEYADQINKGPIGISKDEFVSFYDLEHYKAQKQVLVPKLQKAQDQAQGMSYLNYRIPFPKDGNEEMAWDISLRVFTLLFGKYFQLETLPFSILSFGRSYMGKKYYNTIGEFVDLIPMLIDTSEDNTDIAQQRMNLVDAKNINFMNIWSNDTLKEKWQDVISYYTPAVGAQGILDLVLNFQGAHSEAEIANFEERVKAQAKAGQAMNALFSAMAEVKYTSDYIHFALILKIEKDTGTMATLLDECVQAIVKSYSDKLIVI